MIGYKIALIIEEIDQSYQSSILNGISASAAEFGLNISAFISFSGAVSNPRHDAGEFNIFNLPDFNDFDGAILLTNTIGYKPLVRSILGRIREAGIPAVSIDNNIDGFYHIGIDNKSAMRVITEHMITVHNIRTFNYISGPKENPESADRLSAFLEVLKEHGIETEPERIYYGDFRGPSGKKGVAQFLSSKLPLPQAIICANDVMAASAINRLVAEGYSVPGDIAVTGFDNTYSNTNYQVELTSVDRPLALSGRLACKALYNHFNHIDQPMSNVLGMSTRFTESCGCSQNAVTDIAQFKELNYRNYSKFEESQSFMAKLNNLSCELLGSNTFKDYIAHLEKVLKEQEEKITELISTNQYLEDNNKIYMDENCQLKAELCQLKAEKAEDSEVMAEHIKANKRMMKRIDELQAEVNEATQNYNEAMLMNKQLESQLALEKADNESESRNLKLAYRENEELRTKVQKCEAFIINQMVYVDCSDFGLKSEGNGNNM